MQVWGACTAVGAGRPLQASPQAHLADGVQVAQTGQRLRAQVCNGLLRQLVLAGVDKIADGAAAAELHRDPQRARRAPAALRVHAGRPALLERLHGHVQRLPPALGRLREVPPACAHTAACMPYCWLQSLRQRGRAACEAVMRMMAG